jgi:hypothetical protein
MYSDTISEQRLQQIDKERTETMKQKSFQQWCNELKISAQYVDETLHRNNRERTMNLFNSDEWIATFKLCNKRK